MTKPVDLPAALASFDEPWCPGGTSQPILTSAWH